MSRAKSPRSERSADARRFNHESQAVIAPHATAIRRAGIEIGPPCALDAPRGSIEPGGAGPAHRDDEHLVRLDPEVERPDSCETAHEHPNAPNRKARRDVWDRSMRNIASDFAQIDALVARVADGRITTPDSVIAVAMTLYGDQGPWYTVGWVMASSVERAFGRARLIDVMCDPRGMMQTYNAATRRLRSRGDRLPRWPEPLLRYLAPSRTRR